MVWRQMVGWVHCITVSHFSGVCYSGHGRGAGAGGDGEWLGPSGRTKQRKKESMAEKKRKIKDNHVNSQAGGNAGVKLQVSDGQECLDRRDKER